MFFSKKITVILVYFFFLLTGTCDLSFAWYDPNEVKQFEFQLPEGEITGIDSLRPEGRRGTLVSRSGRPIVIRTVGNNPVDVLEYNVNAVVNPEDSSLSGYAEIVYRMTGSSDELRLDYNCSVGRLDSVKSTRGILEWEWLSTGWYDDSIGVELGRVVEAGELDTLRIWFFDSLEVPPWLTFRIDGVQDTTYFYLAAHNWLPRLPADRDLFTGSLSVRVPGGYEAQAAGELEAESIGEDGSVLRKWTLEYPTAEWPSFGVGRYKKVTAEAGGYKITLYYRILTEDQAASVVDSSLQFLARTAETYGPLPYDHIRLVESNLGRENISGEKFCLFDPYSYGHLMFGFDGNYLNAANHELSRQWWGTVVPQVEHYGIIRALGLYSGLRFNERSRKQYLYNQKGDYASFVERIKEFNDSWHKDFPLSVPGGDDEIYYNKGHWVFYMLENLIGADKLNLALGEFIRENAGRWTTLDDLFATLMAYTDKNLDQFRRKWFDTPGLPWFEVRYSVDRTEEGYQAVVEIEQVESEFEVEMDLVPYPESSFHMRKTLELGPGTTRIVLPLEYRPYSILLDPDNRVLSRIVYPASLVLEDRGTVFNPYEPIPVFFRLNWPGELETLWLHYRYADQAPFDSLEIPPDSIDENMHGRYYIPPAPPGADISFYFSIQGPGGLSQIRPQGAPVGAYRYNVLTPGREDHPFAYIGLEFGDYKSKDKEPVRKNALLRFDLETSQPCKILYDAGNEALHVDTLRNRLLALNTGNRTLDLIDLESFSLARRVELDTLVDPVEWDNAVYDDLEANVYFPGEWLHRLDLETGELQKIDIPSVRWIGILHEQKVMYLISRSYWELIRYDLETDTHENLLKIDILGLNDDLFNLSPEGILLAVGRRHRKPPYTGSIRLAARYWDLNEPTLLDSLELYIEKPYYPHISRRYLTPDGQALFFGLWDEDLRRSEYYLWDLKASVGDSAVLYTLHDKLEPYKVDDGYLSAESYTAPSGVKCLMLHGFYSILVADRSTGELVLLPTYPLTGENVKEYFPPFFPHIKSMAVYPGVQVRPGDINRDDILDMADLIELIENIKSGKFRASGDINRSGRLDILDLLDLLRLLSEQ